MPPNSNYNQVDGTQRDDKYLSLRAAADVPTTRRHADLEAATSSRRSRAGDGAQAGGDLPDQPEGVWYDGTPITWEDFHWQWRASNGTNKAYRSRRPAATRTSRAWSAAATTARSSSPSGTSTPTGRRCSRLLSRVDQQVPRSSTRGGRTVRLRQPARSSSARIDETAKTITLVRNEKWWGNPAKLDRIVFRAIDPDAQIDALANGEIDFIDVGPDVNKSHARQGIEGTEMRIAGGPNFRHLTINGTSPNLQDVRVRRALAMAINRAAIARALLGPLGIDAAALNNHIFMANQRAIRTMPGRSASTTRPSHADCSTRRAGRSRARFARRTAAARDQLRHPFRRHDVPPGVGADSEHAGQVGVTLKINAVPSQDFFDKYISRASSTSRSSRGSARRFRSARRSRSTRNRRRTRRRAGHAAELRARRHGRDRSLFDQATQELDRQKASRLPIASMR